MRVRGAERECFRVEADLYAVLMPHGATLTRR